MLRSLVGSEMCIRDRYQRRVRGNRNRKWWMEFDTIDANGDGVIDRAEWESFAQPGCGLEPSRGVPSTNPSGSRPPGSQPSRSGLQLVATLAQAALDRISGSELDSVARAPMLPVGEQHSGSKLLDRIYDARWKAEQATAARRTAIQGGLQEPAAATQALRARIEEEASARQRVEDALRAMEARVEQEQAGRRAAEEALEALEARVSRGAEAEATAAAVRPNSQQAMPSRAPLPAKDQGAIAVSDHTRAPAMAAVQQPGNKAPSWERALLGHLATPGVDENPPVPPRGLSTMEFETVDTNADGVLDRGEVGRALGHGDGTMMPQAPPSQTTKSQIEQLLRENSELRSELEMNSVVTVEAQASIDRVLEQALELEQVRRQLVELQQDCEAMGVSPGCNPQCSAAVVSHNSEQERLRLRCQVGILSEQVTRLTQDLVDAQVQNANLQEQLQVYKS
eukprot:TRINITY_DN17322_c0_g1_i2.p1 TRINITY_DN17322_c0_g1~~TRINITY_DN17322_c0_g1_i2.p1  ORF type:complete len:453 (-),score=75.21 TRINITY_DN17322_c0_g1_i2:254-1612(-)